MAAHYNRRAPPRQDLDMTGSPINAPPLVDREDRVAEIAAAVAAAGSMAFDLEFVSADRYVPELALVQVAWGDPDAPELALVDPLAVDPAPLFALIADPQVQVVAHAARQDLGLLATCHQTVARALVDTQIAAAMAGLDDQIGYARLVEQLVGGRVDKAHQHTDRKRRPLSEAQRRYAASDVLHLQRVWRELARRLEERGRASWAREESERLARTAARRRPPEEAYLSIGGWRGLKGPARAILRELAAWCEREALASNTPPSCIAPDAALCQLARRAPRRPGEIGRVRGLPGGSARRYGEAIVEAIERGAASGEPGAPPRTPGAAEQAQAAMVLAIVQARSGEAELPVRMVGGRGEADALVAWHREGGGAQPPPGEVLLLEGWRAELCGADALAWLRGEIALAADPGGAGGLRLIDLRRSAVTGR